MMTFLIKLRLYSKFFGMLERHDEFGRVSKKQCTRSAIGRLSAFEMLYGTVVKLNGYSLRIVVIAKKLA